MLTCDARQLPYGIHRKCKTAAAGAAATESAAAVMRAIAVAGAPAAVDATAGASALKPTSVGATGAAGNSGGGQWQRRATAKARTSALRVHILLPQRT